MPELIEIRVESMQEAMEILNTAKANRSVGLTAMNEHSSRSHCIVKVSVSGKNPIKQEQISGKLYLVDLAGSERLSDASEIKETQHINKSLSALGDVIESLAASSPHTPYRNSKLTFLLQDALSAGNKILMICTVSPVKESMQESVCSLNFATRAHRVQLGSSKKNVEKIPIPTAAPNSNFSSSASTSLSTSSFKGSIHSQVILTPSSSTFASSSSSKQSSKTLVNKAKKKG